MNYIYTYHIICNDVIILPVYSLSDNIYDYNNCYLKLREVSDLLSGVNYYIENDSLVVYRSFQTYSIYDEQDYFTRADFRFLIK